MRRLGGQRSDKVGLLGGLGPRLGRGIPSSRRRDRGVILLTRCDGAPNARGKGKDSQVADVECYGVGMDVECTIEEAKGESEAEALVADDGEGGSNPVAAALGALSLTSPFFFWGTSMVAMKFEAVHTTPLFLGSVRLIPAGVALLLWSKIFGGEKRKEVELVPQNSGDWAKILAFAFVDGTCFQGFLAEGIQRTGASLGSIIIDSQPISVAIMAAVFLNEKVTTKTAIGLGVGVLGLAALELPETFWSTLVGLGDASGDLSLSDVPLGEVGADGAKNGEILMLLAAQSMAVGTILVRWVCKTIDPVVATGWHMILGGLPLLAIAAATETDLPQRLEGLSGTDFALLAYITLLGGAASYGIFFVNANRGNLTKLSSLTFLTPVFACLFGNLLLQETFTTSQVAGAGITLLGILLVTVDWDGGDGPKTKED